MTTLVQADIEHNADSLQKTLKDILLKVKDDKRYPNLRPKILRYEFRCPKIDPVIWLHNQKINTKIYWADRTQEHVVAGIGAADIIESCDEISYKKVFEYCQNQLSSLSPQLKYYGGFRFQNASISHEWKAYGAYRFVVPQFELFQSMGTTYFAVNINRETFNQEKVEYCLNELDKLNFDSETKYKAVPKVLSRTDLPNRETWRKLCEGVLKDKLGKEYEKVVLARKSIFQFDVPINPAALIKHLQDMTPNCFHFCFQIGDNEGFLGATPERLLKTVGNELYTEAIAGTTIRGETLEQDEALANKLMNSPKDAREHQFVVDQITSTLKRFYETVEYDDQPSLMKLKGGQHLVTRINARTQNNVSIHEVLAALHPTPAVAGVPTKESLAAINTIEPFDRGWYAGPVGYIGADTVEFSVGIRSGLVSQNHLSLYAGAGLVAGSTADMEWSEIENKISRFIKVFDV